MKIIATLGPSTSNKKVIEDLISSGADTLRLNFSHFYGKQFLEMLSIARNIDKDIKIIADLQGKKIRVDEKLKDTFKIYTNEIVYFCGNDAYDLFSKGNDKIKIIPLNINSEIIEGNEVNKISMKDGTMNFEVIDKDRGVIKVRVKDDGVIRAGKGCNIPGIDYKYTKLSKKDKESLNWAINNNIKIICQSFVESKREIEDIKKYIQENNKDINEIKILSKIETSTGLENYEEIIECCNGIIIARGDLIPEYGMVSSVEAEFELLKKLKKYRKSKEIIIATHILDNMKKDTLPRINELESIYTFINSGATGFLLAGETSIGRYPIKTVKLLNELMNLYKK
ncbi:pyruvate kinase [Clostridium sp. 1001271B_151109_B4]|uniref:pyruvate kinase n=1 Tax=Clostridium sp. 1001271B_151109_B4 TaxID=2787148 RepID=UPI0018ABC5CC|nr:pyruvate kinase [Clostridium sp. 1001271B_151109_B4]